MLQTSCVPRFQFCSYPKAKRLVTCGVGLFGPRTSLFQKIFFHLRARCSLIKAKLERGYLFAATRRLAGKQIKNGRVMRPLELYSRLFPFEPSPAPGPGFRGFSWNWSGSSGFLSLPLPLPLAAFSAFFWSEKRSSKLTLV